MHVTPLLLTGISFHTQYEADHAQLIAKIHTIAKIVASLKEGDSASEVLKELIEYETMMKPHLVQEEIECLPLYRAYFTREEGTKKIQEILAKSPKCELGSFINTSKYH